MYKIGLIRSESEDVEHLEAELARVPMRGEGLVWRGSLYEVESVIFTPQGSVEAVVSVKFIVSNYNATGAQH